MILDCHIHVNQKTINRCDFEERLKLANCKGGIIISLPPNSFYCNNKDKGMTTEYRLTNLLKWTKDNPYLFPFFWIDPMEKDAKEQIDLAMKCGVKGFKVICNKFYPYNPKALNVFKIIASRKRPILFHSGILWDGHPSGVYNRPVNFEALMEIKELKFALAHISWTWCDEHIALYGKIQNSRGNSTAEMFIDLTPGTPLIYREEALTKLHGVGYDVKNNILFGSDCTTLDYDYTWVRNWIETDNDIYDKIGISQNVKDKIYLDNVLRFIGEE